MSAITIRSATGINPVCGTTGCGHAFSPGELRYRADDGLDYCTVNGHGQEQWRVDHAPVADPFTAPDPDAGYAWTTVFPAVSS